MLFTELPEMIQSRLNAEDVYRVATRTNRKGLNITVVLMDDSRLRWLKSPGCETFELVAAHAAAMAALKPAVETPAETVETPAETVELTVDELAALDPREAFESSEVLA